MNQHFRVKLKVKLGFTSFNETGTVIPVVKFHIHPNFDRMSADYDIAIVILKSKVELNPSIKMIGLHYVKPKMFVGNATVSGWGHTKVSVPKLLSIKRIIFFTTWKKA